jgi:uncharacterized membrane protein YraQ (UPF0718 family)
MKKEVGKILIDIAKLVFAGVILAGLMRQDLSAALLFTIGGISTVSMIVAGLMLIKTNNKEQDKE